MRVGLLATVRVGGQLFHIMSKSSCVATCFERTLLLRFREKNECRKRPGQSYLTCMEYSRGAISNIRTSLRWPRGLMLPCLAVPVQREAEEHEA